MRNYNKFLIQVRPRDNPQQWPLSPTVPHIAELGVSPVPLATESALSSEISQMITAAPVAAETLNFSALVETDVQPSVSTESVETETRCGEGCTNNDVAKNVADGSYPALVIDKADSNLAKGSKNAETKSVVAKQPSGTNRNSGAGYSRNEMTEWNGELSKESEVEDWQEVCYLCIDINSHLRYLIYLLLFYAVICIWYYYR